MSLFSITGLTKRFGSLVATDHVDLEIEKDGILSIIGPNGAGKTTFFNLLTGFHKPDEGKILYKGTDITGLSPEKIIQHKISRSFQVVSLFEEMTVLDNMRIGVQSNMGFKGNVFRNFLNNKPVRDKALEILERVHLADIRDQVVTAISHGDRKILDLAMSLTTEPDVLLLDEPMSGLAKGERVRIIQLITEDFNKDMKLIIVEHDMDAVFTISDKILVLNQGAVLALGTKEEIANNAQVQKAYLGERNNA
ncbi:MAG TPA: ABC transporter ATP-binding protein [Syntrophales bacterium]|nr:ABC transporter ATP-binding protein [Syntrophales bacterium]